MAKHNAESIAEALRKRICMEPPTQSPVLHEQSLAEEFGVSRTPVRQALQRLAYGRLVEVRSGVGTVVSPLSLDQREMDLDLAFNLLAAAAQIEGDRPISLEAATYLNVIERQLSTMDGIELEANYDMRAKLMEIFINEMTNDILADALSAALWRVFRWRMAEAVESHNGIDRRLPEVVARMAEATKVGTLRALFEAQLMGATSPLKAVAGGRMW